MHCTSLGAARVANFRDGVERDRVSSIQEKNAFMSRLYSHGVQGAQAIAGSFEPEREDRLVHAGREGRVLDLAAELGHLGAELFQPKLVHVRTGCVPL